MRFTFEPAGDVVVEQGTDLGACREALAALGGSAALLPLSAAGVPLTDDQVAGAPPWTPGSVLRAGPTAPDPVTAVRHAPWHLAVVAGPGAGAMAAPGRDGTVSVGRAPVGGTPTGGPHGPAPVGTLAVPDPAVSRVHATVGRRRGDPGRWWVRDDGSANGTVLVDARRRRSRCAVRRRPRPLRPGDRVVVGMTTIELRAPGAPPRPHPVPRRAALAGLVRSARHPSVLVPLTGALVLAAVLRSPVLLAMALVAPVTAVLARAGDRGAGAQDVPTSVVPVVDALAHAVDGSPVLCDPATAIRDAGAAGPVPARSLVAGAHVRVPHVPGSPARGGAGDEGRPAWWGLTTAGGLGVVGPSAATHAVVRALLADVLADPDAELALLQGAGPTPWAWLRWAGDRLCDGQGARVAVTAPEAAAVLDRCSERTVVVVDRATAWAGMLHRWWLRRPGSSVVVVAERTDELPGWCSWVVRVAPDGAATLAGPGFAGRVEAPGLDLDAAEAQARRCAALARAGTGPEGPGCPRTPGSLPPRVALVDLLPGPDRDDGALTAPVGVGPDGPVVVDLLRDGPHALVAGTTGAGKSELLQTLVLALATRYPPAELAVVVVDYKGGAGLGACSALPHVVAQVTDLDEAGAWRALEGLRTELRRRERLLADAGVSDVRGLVRGVRPPRLLVVVDEFRALVEDVPPLVPALVRLATQGRSLGIHLVLATQRPAGVVDAQLRANLPLRICLRVTDAADSRDVVGVPDAAGLPAEAPGRAVLCRPGAEPVTVQTAWAALPAGRPTDDPVAPALPWGDWSPWRVPDGPPAAVRHGPAGDHVVAELVSAARDAHRRTGLPVPEAPWLPPLPERVPLPAQDGDDLVLGVTDVPAERARGSLAWSPSRTHLAVVGGPGSGRTTALVAAAHAALAHALPVHVVHTGDAAWTTLRATGHPLLGTLVGADDPATMASLLRLLRDGTATGVLVVDDVATVREALDRLPRASGADLVDTVVRDARGRVAVALSGAPRDLGRLLPHVGERLVLGLPDRHDATGLGVPERMWSAVAPPGRGVHVPAGLMAQIGLPGSPPAAPGRGGPPPPRLVRLPTDVGLGELPAGGIGLLAPTADALVVRHGTPARTAPPLDGRARTAPDPARAHPARAPIAAATSASGPVLDLARGLLVVGPPGSGRSTALRSLVARLPDIGLVPVGADHLAERVGPDDGLARERGVAVVVDDLDVVVRRDPALDDRLLALVEHGCPVIAAARADRVATAYRGALAALRAAAPMLVLWPEHPTSAEAAGEDLTPAVDPVRPRTPGRAALIDRGPARAVQLARA